VLVNLYGTKRRITLALELPWDTNNDDLYAMGYAGAPAHLKFKYGSYSTLFSIRNFKAPGESPFVKDEKQSVGNLAKGAGIDVVTVDNWRLGG
jgi:hypothetical protein